MAADGIKPDKDFWVIKNEIREEDEHESIGGNTS